MNTLKPLQDVLDQGMQPAHAEFWLFLDLPAYRTNGLVISSCQLPSADDCRAVAGLDVILVFEGDRTSYAILRRLCGLLLSARPRRLQALVHDYKKMAYLKHGAFPC